MSSIRQFPLRKILSSACSFVRTKPLLSSIICILAAVLFFYHDCSMYEDPTDLKNMKHGFIKTIPDHLLSTVSLGRDREKETKDTLQRVVPPIVHYVWCHKNNFQYQNYLSVLSAYKLFKPTEIIFHHNNLPQTDPDGYYQYYKDLQRDLPNLFPEPLTDQIACSDNVLEAVSAIGKMMNQQGGIFVGLNVILSPEMMHYMDEPVSIYIPTSMFASNGVMFLSPGGLHSVAEKDNIKQFSSSINCVSYSSYSHGHYPCSVVPKELFPFQIAELTSDFGDLARAVGYSSKDLKTPKPQNSLVPNIVHYVWLRKKQFNFFSYLSLLSSLYIQKAEAVYIHGDVEPVGQYWEKVKVLPKMKFIFREFPHTVYGNKIESPSHVVGYLRMDILLRYGGVYVDWEVIWTKQLSDKQRRYETIASFDWPKTGNFPETFNLGIFGAKKGSRFVTFMLESFRYNIDSDRDYSPNRVPYKVYEQHPDSVFVDGHLQLICFPDTCHVSVPGNKRDVVSKTESGEFNWRTEINAVHWTYPDPEEFSDKKTLLASSGLYADIGKNVLELAGS